jgi:tetratricopeptide (TPR) repeat protein
VGRSPEELHRLAVEWSIGGKYARARRALAEAAAGTDDIDLQARIVGTNAYILQRTGAPAEAERLCAEALGRPGLSAHTVAILSGQMGVLALHGGRFDEAVTWLSRAIGGLEGDEVRAARSRLNRSVAYMALRRLDEASADLESAAATFAAHGLEMDEAHARHNLGYAALLSGDLVRALEAMASARPAAAASPVAAAIGDLDRAEVLRDAGLVREAERTLAQVADTFGTRRMPQSRAEAEFTLARSLLTHDPVSARRVAGAAARRFEGLGNRTWAARAEAVRLRAELAGDSIAPGGGRVPAPRRMPTPGEVERLAGELDARGLRSEAAALRMTRAVRAASRPGGGTPDGARLRIPGGATMEVRLLAHEARAARAAAAGREGDVRRWAAEGLDLLERWQETFGSLDLQTSAAMHGRGLALAGLRSALRSRRPELVFDWSERARQISQRVVPLRPPPDPELAGDLAQLRMMRADDPSGAWQASPRAEALRERARERQWRSTGGGGVHSRVSIDEVRAELGRDTALIAYVFTGDAMTALVVRHDGADLVPIDGWEAAARGLAELRADLDMAASIRDSPLAAVVGRSLEGKLAALSRLLLDGPLAAAGTRRLVLTTPGILNGIPWGMLPGFRGRAFTLAVSATRWTRMRSHDAPGGALTAGFAVGPRVPRGGEEVTAAAAAWPGATMLDGTDASVDGVTRLASRVDVLHIAAHGRHAVDNPLFSGLELADGTLFGYDIDLMPEVPATVVLSACEVGRSSVRWGEEAIGMTRIWLHAGTRCVVAAPVIVADDAACDLLGAMHEGLAVGEAPAEALAGAAERTGIVAPFQVHGAGL